RLAEQRLGLGGVDLGLAEEHPPRRIPGILRQPHARLVLRLPRAVRHEQALHVGRPGDGNRGEPRHHAPFLHRDDGTGGASVDRRPSAYESRREIPGTRRAVRAAMPCHYAIRAIRGTTLVEDVAECRALWERIADRVPGILGLVSISGG